MDVLIFIVKFYLLQTAKSLNDLQHTDLINKWINKLNISWFSFMFPYPPEEKF